MLSWNPVSDHSVFTNLCTSQQLCCCGLCKICINQWTGIWFTAKHFFFHQIWIVSEKSLVRWATGLNMIGWDLNFMARHTLAVASSKKTCLFFHIYSIAKPYVRFCLSHSYLTGVTTAELRRHLSNGNVIFNGLTVVFIILITRENNEMEEIIFRVPHPWLGRG